MVSGATLAFLNNNATNIADRKDSTHNGPLFLAENFGLFFVTGPASRNQEGLVFCQSRHPVSPVSSITHSVYRLAGKVPFIRKK